MIVVDASTMTAALIDAGPAGAWARAQLAESDLVAPELLPAEVTSALRKAERLGHVDADTAEGALTDLADFRLELYPWSPVAWRVWELRHNLTPYDAWYVGLAELLDLPLISLDHGIAAAPGIRCVVRLGPGG